MIWMHLFECVSQLCPQVREHNVILSLHTIFIAGFNADLVDFVLQGPCGVHIWTSYYSKFPVYQVINTLFMLSLVLDSLSSLTLKNLIPLINIPFMRINCVLNHFR